MMKLFQKNLFFLITVVVQSTSILALASNAMQSIMMTLKFVDLNCLLKTTINFMFMIATACKCFLVFLCGLFQGRFMRIDNFLVDSGFLACKQVLKESL